MRWIYLSPHLDDAVLSAGGLIHEQSRAGIPVEIWTLMCGYPPKELSPFAELLHAHWGFSSGEETARLRRAEDRRAAAILGAKTRHFDFLDCIYRRAENGDWLYEAVFIPPRPEDEGLPAEIAEAVSAHLRPDDILVCQLAVGSHVDHVLVRQGAERLGRPLLYDIDIPYIFAYSGELAPKSAGMQLSVHPIPETALEPWKEAVLAYKSQFPGLGESFNTPEKVQESLRSYWAESAGLRIFQVG